MQSNTTGKNQSIHANESGRAKMLAEKNKRIDQLMDETIDLEHDIIFTVKTLAQETQWDSNILKTEVVTLLSQFDRIDSELRKIGFYCQCDIK